MYPVCACSIDADWYYREHPETGEDTFNEWRASLRPHRCCECYEIINPGMSYDHFEGWNPEEKEWEMYDTCKICMDIWDDLCGEGRSIGTLDELLWESCGMSLNGEMDDDDEHWDAMWQDAIEFDQRNRETARRFAASTTVQ